jgi:4'-phosphopantetheinyl transferase
MNRVRLYFVSLKIDSSWAQISNTLFHQRLSELSLQKQDSIQRLINEKDRLSSLFGLYLLKRCVQDEEIPDFQLSDIKYPESGKPYWHRESSHGFDFNISHSEDLILVAMSKTLKVGVDIEKRRNLKRLNFKMVMSAEELEKIQQTPDMFFDLWSKKEAVVKAADTAGISRMRDVILENERAMLDDVCWYIKTIDKLIKLEEKFSAHLATSQPVDELIIKQMSLDDFSN